MYRNETVIPFRKEFREVMVNGIKTATSRTRKFGDEGDVFNAFGVTFRISSVIQMPLSDVANNYWREEGAKSPQDFRRIWKEIHPRKGWDSNQNVYLHRFFMATISNREKKET